MVARLGWDLGSDVNESIDNLWFTLLFKRTELWPAAGTETEFNRAAMTFQAVMSGGAIAPGTEAWVRSLTLDRPQHDADWLRRRAESLLAAAAAGARSAPPRWGWKEPNTHVFVERLVRVYPDMQYVHVVRNGLDMAYSANQNQLGLWGPLMLGAEAGTGPRASLRYWCEAQRRIESLRDRMPDRVLLLSFDALCRDPRPSLEALLAFVGIDPAPSVLTPLMALVEAPGSIGRFKPRDLGTFDASDVEYVRTQGFDVERTERQVRP